MAERLRCSATSNQWALNCLLRRGNAVCVPGHAGGLEDLLDPFKYESTGPRPEQIWEFGGCEFKGWLGSGMQTACICNALLWRLSVRMRSGTFRFQSTSLVGEKQTFVSSIPVWRVKVTSLTFLTQVVQWTGDSSNMISELPLHFRWSYLRSH